MTQISLTRRSLIAGLAMTPLLPSLGHATGSGSVTLNVAGRQRMLSQRMARAGLFAWLEVNRKRHLTLLQKDHELFDTTLQDLQNGNPAKDIQAASTPEAKAALDSVVDLWSKIAPTYLEISGSNDITAEQMQVIAQTNGLLLLRSNEFVKGLLAGQVSAASIPVNISGRQRMLTQKIAKEVALVALGIDLDTNQPGLLSTIQQFEDAHQILLSGSADLSVPPPSDEIAKALKKVTRLWSDFSRVATHVADTGIASEFELNAIAKQTDPLMRRVNDVVTLYAQS